MTEALPTVNDLHTTALRTFVLEGPDVWATEYGDVLEGDAARGFSFLLYHALATAARDKFSPTYSNGQIIRYVADLRTSLPDDARNLNPRVAEGLIRWVLGDATLDDAPPFGTDQMTVIGIELILLVALITEAGLDDEGIEDLIREAATAAREASGT
ncbi:hypothetical protein LUW74_17980 [Actinomadura madurae]|uniref:hypothetical protein n=1 Tax=Actinomadura madurae TaxID=1993 RepID=UPI002026D3DE|nr:hypothetical protein [Actinomadura madurae]URN05022.1 hypothetical protein LUW74_17980 [Actinomadura madurae]